MIAPKHLTLALLLAAPLLFAGVPAQAFTARQASAQGQGTFVTSSGTPQNLMQSGPVAQQDDSTKRPLRSHQHDRYFAGF